MNNLQKEIKSLIGSYNTLKTYYKKELKVNIKSNQYLAAYCNQLAIDTYESMIKDLKFILKEK